DALPISRRLRGRASKRCQAPCPRRHPKEAWSMIVVDTGPGVAPFDPLDAAHDRARRALESVNDALVTTPAGLTEALHLLGGWSRGTDARAYFIAAACTDVWFPDGSGLGRLFQLMKQCADRPMDFADASLVCAAEHFRTTRVFTIDRNDFSTYRVRIGKTSKPL